MPSDTAVKAIELCTVEGMQPIYRNPTPMAVGSQISDKGFSARARTGNSTKVSASTDSCSRQFASPATMVAVVSFAPYRKNSSAMTQ